MDLVLRRGIKIPKIKQTSFVYRPEPETAPICPSLQRKRRWVLAATATTAGSVASYNTALHWQITLTIFC